MFVLMPALQPVSSSSALFIDGSDKASRPGWLAAKFGFEHIARIIPEFEPLTPDHAVASH
jgi:hypothetical protein